MQPHAQHVHAHMPYSGNPSTKNTAAAPPPQKKNSMGQKSQQRTRGDSHSGEQSQLNNPVAQNARPGSASSAGCNRQPPLAGHSRSFKGGREQPQRRGPLALSHPLAHTPSLTGLTSHCLALKKVEGPTGGPSAGGTITRRLPPTRMLRMPSSKPACMPPGPRGGEQKELNARKHTRR